ncbi:aminoacyl-tRNA hydrolase [Candidatus Peregrinibacteria bacterium]|jgi:peptidyl-tRNA hydrolase, PTH1 family|nr:aminoacyl-tRNA hydrolase [Candidatus Peregrinibacteria bacterium]MBT4148311.1 aminoacyl-tRNA hydrolase [Candidatus Peregrinibacteria bacterium]MBT4366408.1 aminoacyl-tRNA hydrolase [Candidatus Peregrinibacteria bacterium]MBT4455936.1 aminoacyl-tRNA hydrolase [Candidatus Peregrinibacteria bacterium]
MKIIVGLGNIGDQYMNNRHNVGFMTLDLLFEKLGCDKWKENSKLKAITAETTLNGEKVFLAKPTTFMNLSGEAISKILSFYKESPEDLTVIYDDLDLPLGTIRTREKGSAGTHNGMKSAIQHLGTEEFTRIRLGIESRGELAPEQQDTSSYVLSDFTKEEKPLIEKAMKEVVETLI